MKDSAKVEEKKQLTTRNFSAAPKRTLNLAPSAVVPLKKDWVAKAEQALVKEVKKETKRERKRRIWNERIGGKRTREVKHYGNWEYLPDLCLEQIFQYLPYEVSILSS